MNYGDHNAFGNGVNVLLSVTQAGRVPKIILRNQTPDIYSGF